MIEAFRRRGIYPKGVSSLGEEALLWPAADQLTTLDVLPLEVRDMVMPDLIAFDRRSQGPEPEFDPEVKRQRLEAEPGEAGDMPTRRQQIFDALFHYGRENADALFLDAQGLRVAGYNTTFRVGEDGKLRTEFVIQWFNDAKADPKLGGLKEAAGTTVVYTAEGMPRYIIPKPRVGEWQEEIKKAAKTRWLATREFVDESDARDPDAAWSDPAWWGRRMEIRFGFAGLHRGVGRPF
jgi:hypothetical protein